MPEKFQSKTDNPLVPLWRENNRHVPFSEINENLLSYMDSLPLELQKNIYITSSKGDEHSTNSRHYKGAAFDIRINNKENIEQDPLLIYLGSDSNMRKEKNIVVLNPEHGTAPHIHLSYGQGTENKLDYFYGKNGVNLNQTTLNNDNDANTYLKPNFTENTEAQNAFLAEYERIQEITKKEIANVDEETLKAQKALKEKQERLNTAVEVVKNFKLDYSGANYNK